MSEKDLLLALKPDILTFSDDVSEKENMIHELLEKKYWNVIVNFFESKKITYREEDKEAFYYFCSPVLKDIWDNKPESVRDIFELCCEKGHIDFVIFYQKKMNICIPKDFNNFNKNNVFEIACKYGHLKIAQFLFSIWDINIHIKDECAFLIACEYGHVKVAKWLYSLGNINIHSFNEYAFRYACENGHINVAKWLYSLGNVNIHAESEDAFLIACKNGHLDIIKWIYSLGNVNIHSKEEYAFRYACENGHINVAKWLYSLGNVNIHAKEEYAFRWACEDGHLEVAKWLYSLGQTNDQRSTDQKSVEGLPPNGGKNVNIHAKNDEVFKEAIENKNIDIIQFLYNLDPIYYGNYKINVPSLMKLISDN